MSMAEICYELRGFADFLVGCETYSPASGWPYRQILERLKNDFVDSKGAERKAVAAEVAKSIVDEYTNYYAPYWMSGLSVAQSALDLSKVEDLRSLVNKLGTILEKELLEEYEPDTEKRLNEKHQHPFRDALVLAHWEAQSYNGELFVDLYDFCDCLESRVSSREVLEACTSLKEFIEHQFVVRSCFSGAAYQYSYGISIYFPWSEVASSYSNIDFVQQSLGLGWGSFLTAYTLITRREPRGVDLQAKLSEVPSLGLNEHLSQTRMMVDRMMVDRMMVDRMMVDRMMVDRMMVDRMMVDRMEAGGSSNPMHSMRNPPVVFFPTFCIRDREQVISIQERFWDRPIPKADR
jgi:hypothetical protein